VECLGPKERRKSSDFSRRRKSCSDVDVRTSSGRLFQTAGDDGDDDDDKRIYFNVA